MPDRFSKVAAFILGPSAKDEEDDFETEFADADSDDEPTDIVDIEAARSTRSQPQQVHHGTVTPIDQRRRPASSKVSISQIRHVRPYSFSEAAKIGETFKEGVPIVLNLTTTDEKQAQKLIDFASGMAFVTDGKLERITPRVFLLIPASIEFTESDRDQLADRVHE